MKKHIPSPKVRRDFLMPDALWEEIQPLLPKPPKTHPFGGGRPRVSDRRAMDAIFFVLRTGCQWNALNKTGLCSSSSAHRRFQEWVKRECFSQYGEKGLPAMTNLKGSTVNGNPWTGR
jgi:hypothetical protein